MSSETDEARSPLFDETFITSAGTRDQNQDSFGVSSVGATRCWVLADGVGGSGDGKTAAEVTVQAILASFASDPLLAPESVRTHIDRAHAAIVSRQANVRGLASMQTTVVLLITDGAKAVWGHVGDSRLYHFRGGRISSQTLDHSASQAKVYQGFISSEAIRSDPDRNRLIQAIGQERPFNADVRGEAVDLCRNDSFLLCVDGFWAAILEAEMEIDWAKSLSAEDWVNHMRRRVQDRAIRDMDNYSVCAIKIVNPALPEPPKVSPCGAAGSGLIADSSPAVRTPETFRSADTSPDSSANGGTKPGPSLNEVTSDQAGTRIPDGEISPDVPVRFVYVGIVATVVLAFLFGLVVFWTPLTRLGGKADPGSAKTQPPCRPFSYRANGPAEHRDKLPGTLSLIRTANGWALRFSPSAGAVQGPWILSEYRVTPGRDSVELLAKKSQREKRVYKLQEGARFTEDQQACLSWDWTQR